MAETGQIVRGNEHPPKKLTGKQKAFVKAYAMTLNATKAAKAAYDTNDNTARNIGSENLANPNIQREISRTLESSGLNDSFISNKFKDLVEAGTSPKALSKALPKDALRALELVAKMLGYLDKHSTNKTLVLKADLSKKTTNELREELRKLREEEDRYLNS